MTGCSHLILLAAVENNEIQKITRARLEKTASFMALRKVFYSILIYYWKLFYDNLCWPAGWWWWSRSMIYIRKWIQVKINLWMYYICMYLQQDCPLYQPKYPLAIIYIYSSFSWRDVDCWDLHLFTNYLI